MDVDDAEEQHTEEPARRPGQFTINDVEVRASKRTQGKTQDRAAKRNKVATMMAKRFSGVTQEQCVGFLTAANDDLTTALLSLRENYRGPKPTDDTLHAFRAEVDKQLDATPDRTTPAPSL